MEKGNFDYQKERKLLFGCIWKSFKKNNTGHQNIKSLEKWTWKNKIKELISNSKEKWIMKNGKWNNDWLNGRFILLDTSSSFSAGFASSAAGASGFWVHVLIVGEHVEFCKSKIYRAR